MPNLTGSFFLKMHNLRRMLQRGDRGGRGEKYKKYSTLSASSALTFLLVVRVDPG